MCVSALAVLILILVYACPMKKKSLAPVLIILMVVNSSKPPSLAKISGPRFDYISVKHYISSEI